MQVDVEQLTVGPVVGAPTVSDSSPATGATFTLSATVRNAGDGESAATMLRFYRSTDAMITPDDTASRAARERSGRRVFDPHRC